MQDTKTAAIMALAQDYAISWAASNHLQSQPEDEARTERARLALLAEVASMYAPVAPILRELLDSIVAGTYEDPSYDRINKAIHAARALEVSLT